MKIKQTSTMSFLLVITGIFALTAFMPKNATAFKLPSIEKLEKYRPTLSTKIYDINGELVDEFYTEKRTFVPFKKAPKHLINAIITIEDDDFYKHWGISMKGIIRAAKRNISKRKVVQGGSTITQQLAKTAFLTQERTFSRKAKELILALKLERKYSKNEILEMYLNQIYFGHGVYGIDLAAKLYFDKDLSELTLAECAVIAALPKAPTSYSPFHDPERCLARRNIILKKMHKLKYINKQELDTALAEELQLSPRGPKLTKASYFVEHVRQELEKTYGDQLYKGGLKIHTTLDLNMQIAAEEILAQHLSEFDIMKSSEAAKEKEKEEKEGKKQKTKKENEEVEKIEEIEEEKIEKPYVQGALIAIEPKTGQIRAMCGGRDFRKSQFNRATRAFRQPGSAFKPIIYTAALDRGFTAVSLLEDSPLVYYNDGLDWRLIGKTTDYSDIEPNLKESLDFEEPDPEVIWIPKNYKEKYKGEVSLRYSLENSINLSTIRLLETITPQAAVDYAKKLGITSDVKPYLSIALGTFVITPLELARAYATLANQGVRSRPYTVTKIIDNTGTVLEERFPKQDIVISQQTAYIITNLLKGVIEHGTGRRGRLGRPAAGKTGTTNEFVDSWFVGYTPDLATTVWVGYDDNKTLGEKMSGSAVACPIWADFMYKVLEEMPPRDFGMPANIVFIPIDKKTNQPVKFLTKSSYLEAFVKGNEPSASGIPGMGNIFPSTTPQEKQASAPSTPVKEKDSSEKNSTSDSQNIEVKTQDDVSSQKAQEERRKAFMDRSTAHDEKAISTKHLSDQLSSPEEIKSHTIE